MPFGVQENALELYYAVLNSPAVVAMNEVCRNASTVSGFGPMTCFQLYDIISWIEYMAINWVWLPEFVRSTGTAVINTTLVHFQSNTSINAGPLVKVSIGRACYQP